MNPHPLIRSWRAARVATACLALAAAALTVSGSASSPTVTSTTGAADARAATVVAPCLSASPNQRVRADSGLDGVDPNDVTPAQTEAAEAALQARARRHGLVAGRASLPKTKIDVYVHVITDDAGKGGVSRSRIKKQVSVLNKAYAGKTSSRSTKTPFSFRLKAVDKTASSDWYDWGNPELDPTDDQDAKTALHRGGFDDLNLYVTSLSDGLLGYSSFPFDTTLPLDGVVVLNASLPGGSAKGYSKGDSATHEVGHWLGLFHTFENGCTSPGDKVDDTPYQADGDNVFSCSTKLDTCRAKGKDPVHNFMSYGDDACLNRFSKGQVARMVSVWRNYRASGSAG
ncbi:zinc metalloprotease [Microlunatus spumicola]|uniref:Zinc metalloprotease n=1 Tax=Microlunatus spumicola TaxID=81499 RepID=A0ABP6XXE3_9ACTN